MIKAIVTLACAMTLTGCAVSSGAPLIHESTTFDYTVSNQVSVQNDYVTAVPVLSSRRSYERQRYYVVQEICRTISNDMATPRDIGAVAKRRCTFEEVPRERRVQNGWIITFKHDGVIYEQYVNFNPGSVVLIRISNNSIMGVNP